METKLTAEEFEEHVRRQCVKILRACHHGRPEQAAEFAEELGNLAVSRKREREMNAEAGSDYDLAALGGLPMNAPEIEE